MFTQFALAKKEANYAKFRGRCNSDEFEVSVFLAETDTRHSILMKQKRFSEKSTVIRSNSSRLLGIGENNVNPINVESVIRTEDGGDDDDDDELITLDDIPSIDDDVTVTRPRRSKRQRDADTPTAIHSQDETVDSMFVGDVESSDKDYDMGASESRSRKRQRQDTEPGDNDDANDKKKLAATVTYQGFAIYGRVLCLVVKRKHGHSGAMPSTGQAVMENWLSTQMPQPEEDA